MRIYESDIGKNDHRILEQLQEHRWLARLWVDENAEPSIDLRWADCHGSWQFKVGSDFGESENFYEFEWRIENTPLSGDIGYHCESFSDGTLFYGIALDALTALSFAVHSASLSRAESSFNGY